MALELTRDKQVLRHVSSGLPVHAIPDQKELTKRLRADQLRAKLIVDGLRVQPYPRQLRPRPRFAELFPNEACRQFLDSDEGRLAFFDVEQDVARATNLCEGLMRTLQSVGPVRAHPSQIPRYLDESVSSPEGNRTDLPISAVLAENEPLLQQANEWLRRLEIPYELITRSLYRAHQRAVGSVGPASRSHPDVRELRLRDLRRQGVEVGFSDVGFGISQILPVVCQLLLTKNAVITVEQPELHVHPSLQAEMGELFVYSAQVLRNQLIVETHSEHLALRLQRCVRHRREGISPDTFSLVYLDAPNAETTAQPLPLGKAGELTVAPPQGWFLERLHELMPKDA